MFQLRYTNSVYATSDTGELDGTGERVALMLQPPPPHMLMGWRHPLHQQHRLPRPRLSCHDIDSVQLQVFSTHRHPTTVTTTPFETDEAERHGRVLLMLQLRYTGSWTPTRP